MADLADAMNTWDLALELIHRGGFKVTRRCDDEHPDESPDWEARDSEGHTMVACDPLALLALCQIWNQWGEEWKTIEIRKWYSNIMDLDL